ncbi:Diphthamide biosynthesis protein 2 [Homalodisca vitripennis]|nr:Diphthamide biosynthesis protein 2 [Homalodisca vitripennis]
MEDKVKEMENEERKHIDKIEHLLQLNADVQTQLSKEKKLHLEAQCIYEEYNLKLRQHIDSYVKRIGELEKDIDVLQMKTENREIKTNNLKDCATQLQTSLPIQVNRNNSTCCVDEVAAQHVDGDAVIHMGHTCLSPTTRLPVLHLLPRASLDLSGLVSAFAHFYSTTNGPVLLLYDVAYGHLIDEIRERLDEFKERVVISQLNIPDGQLQACGLECDLHRGSNTHQTTLLGRSYCCQSPSSVVYITHRHSQNMLNFALSMRNIQFFTYPRETEKATEDFNKSFRRRLYLVEKIKDAKTLGILVGTLSVEKYLGAIEKMKKLATYRGKRCYIFSIGKPNPAKLANFPEVEVFVLVSCPESILENEKDYMQPVVTLLEAELALNPSMHWDDQLSVDFRDLLEGLASFKLSQLCKVYLEENGVFKIVTSEKLNPIFGQVEKLSFGDARKEHRRRQTPKKDVSYSQAAFAPLQLKQCSSCSVLECMVKKLTQQVADLVQQISAPSVPTRPATPAQPKVRTPLIKQKSMEGQVAAQIKKIPNAGGSSTTGKKNLSLEEHQKLASRLRYKIASQVPDRSRGANRAPLSYRSSNPA